MLTPQHIMYHSQHLHGTGLGNGYGLMIFELDSGVAPWSLPWQRLRTELTKPNIEKAMIFDQTVSLS